MHRIGLALSGGGFRATLFHLGMIRFLREANLLSSVTHITSVSGGSIVAAHLVLNWHRYNDSLKEFDAAAAELIRFVQLDVRNRVVRRYPLVLPLRALRWLTYQNPYRQLTRTGLLEYHYEKFLYGDTCLFQLPEHPRLFILATNLSEGCLCAFTRDGLLMQRREPGGRFHFDRIHTGLATVPMAVTASSAFPGFFPPLELVGQDVGTDPGHFGRLAFTDGGVYDNLGVRMFRCLERSWMAREIRLNRDDLADYDEAVRAFDHAARGAEGTPLRRLAQLMNLSRPGASVSSSNSGDRLLEGLRDVMNHENLAREPEFATLTPPDPDAMGLLTTAQSSDAEIDPGELTWLNRHLVDLAFRQATGKPCFRSLNACFDTVLVSDAGKQFKIANDARAGGLISTAMRATDIVMDRVWQLETDTFSGTPGFVFAPISTIVAPEEDPTVLHPEIQRMAADIRTDLDRFSPLEIQALIRHGYCVGRSVCRRRPELFGGSIPSEAPWDPLASEGTKTTSVAPTVQAGKPAAAAPETEQSRILQRSASRSLWTTLLDYRDWTSFLYVPLLIPILIVLPYYLIKWYNHAQTAQRLIEGIAQSSQDFEVINKLLQEGPVAPFKGMPISEDQILTPLDFNGFEVIADTRVLDLRPWKYRGKTEGEPSWAYMYRRSRVKKCSAEAKEFAIRFRGSVMKGQARTVNNRLPSLLRTGRDPEAEGSKPSPAVDIVFDFTKVPVNEVVDVSLEFMGSDLNPELLRSTTFFVDVKTALFSYWLLLPEGKHYGSMDLFRYPIGKAASPERIVPANELVSLNGQIAAFTLLSLEPGFMYERRWTYRD